MEIITYEAMQGSNSVFYDWRGFEIPVKNLKMPEATDVVERFSRKGKNEGPMRSAAAQRAADIIHETLQFDTDPKVGLFQDYDRSLRHYWNYPKILIPTIAILSNATYGQFDRAVNAVL